MLRLQNEIRHTLLPVATCEICKEPLFSAFSFSEIICWLSLLILTYKSDASIIFLGVSKKNKTLPFPWVSSSTASSALCLLATSGFPLSLCRQTQEGLFLVFAGAQRCVTGGNSKSGGWAPSLYFHMNRIYSKKSVKMYVSRPWIYLIKQSQMWFPFFGVGFFTFFITQMWLSKILVQGPHSQKDGPLLKLLTKLLRLFTNVNLFLIFLFLIKPAL